MEPYFNHPRKEITEINSNLIEIMAPYRFPIGTWWGIGGFTLGSIINIMEGNLYDQLVSSGIFTFKMNKIFIYAQNIMTKFVTDTIWN